MVDASGELMPYHRRMAELVFEVVQESDGGYCAECLTESIFSESAELRVSRSMASGSAIG
jgi:hypothetical protein